VKPSRSEIILVNCPVPVAAISFPEESKALAPESNKIYGTMFYILNYKKSAIIQIINKKVG
jgi:hypothetical protein